MANWWDDPAALGLEPVAAGPAQQGGGNWFDNPEALGLIPADAPEVDKPGLSTDRQDPARFDALRRLPKLGQTGEVFDEERQKDLEQKHAQFVLGKSDDEIAREERDNPEYGKWLREQKELELRKAEDDRLRRDVLDSGQLAQIPREHRDRVADLAVANIRKQERENEQRGLALQEAVRHDVEQGTELTPARLAELRKHFPESDPEQIKKMHDLYGRAYRILQADRESVGTIGSELERRRTINRATKGLDDDQAAVLRGMVMTLAEQLPEADQHASTAISKAISRGAVSATEGIGQFALEVQKMLGLDIDPQRNKHDLAAMSRMAVESANPLAKDKDHWLRKGSVGAAQSFAELGPAFLTGPFAPATLTAMQQSQTRQRYKLEGLRDDVADKVAWMTAPIEAQIETISNQFAPQASKAITSSIRQTIVNAIKERLKAVGKEFLEEGAQGFVHELGGQIGKAIDEQKDLDVDTRQALNAGIENMIEAAPAIAVMMAPGSSVQTAREIRAGFSQSDIAKAFRSPMAIDMLIEQDPRKAMHFAERDPNMGGIVSLIGQDVGDWSAEDVKGFHDSLRTHLSFRAQPEPRSTPQASPAGPASLTPEGPATPSRTSFQNEAELRLDRLREQGWSDEQLAQAQQAGLFATDTVTGYQEGRTGNLRTETARRAVEHVDQTGEPAAYVEFDLRNLGGLNSRLGHSGANQVFTDVAAIVREETSKIGGDASYFRHGGDELSILAVNVPPEQLRQAMIRAQERVRDYAKAKGLDEIEHPKHKGDLTRRGTGISFGVSPIEAGDSIDVIFKRADKEVERHKKEGSDVSRISSGTSGPVPSGGRRGSPSGRAGEGDPGRRREAGPESAGQGTGAEVGEAVGIDVPPAGTAGRRRDPGSAGEAGSEAAGLPSEGQIERVEREIARRGRSIDQIADSTGLSHGAVREALKLLGKQGRIEIQETAAGDRYHLKQAGKKKRGRPKAGLTAEEEARRREILAEKTVRTGKVPGLLPDKFAEILPDIIKQLQDLPPAELHELAGDDTSDPAQRTLKKAAAQILAERAAGVAESVQATTTAPQVPVALAPAGGLPVSSHGIIATMSQLFDVPIKRGKVLAKALGIYKVRPEVVQIRGEFAGDLAVSTHEVAHHIDKGFGVSAATPHQAELAALDYDPDLARPDEGFAEFIRHYLTRDDAHQVAPQFYDWFRNQWLPQHQDLRGKLDRVRSLIDRWRQQGAVARGQASLRRIGETITPEGLTASERFLREHTGRWDRFVTEWKDAMRPLDKFSQEARSAGHQPNDLLPIEKARAMSQAGPVFAKRALDEGVFSMVSNQRIGPSLKEVYDGVEDPQALSLWMVAKHALEVHRAGLGNPGISEADAEYIVSQYQSPDFERRQKLHRQFHAAMVQMLGEVGFYSPDEVSRILHFGTGMQARELKGVADSYVPLLRVAEKSRALGAGRRLADSPLPISRRHGSGLPIVDPADAAVQMATRFYTVAARQQVMNSIADVAENVEGMGDWVDIVPADKKKHRLTLDPREARKAIEDAGIDPAAIPDDLQGLLAEAWRPDPKGDAGRQIVRLTRNGRPMLLQFTEPELYKFISAMQPDQVEGLMRLGNYGKRLVQLGATTLNPNFWLRNLVRDYQNALPRAKDQGLFRMLLGPVAGAYTYARAKLVGDPFFKLWDQAGGRLSRELGFDHQSIRRVADQLTGRKPTWWQKTKGVLPAMIRFGEDVVSTAEVAPRINQFQASMEAQGYSRARLEQMQQQGVSPPLEVVLRAVQDAHEVTIDFRRMGAKGRTLNQIVPFFNASLEGPANWLRLARERPGKFALWTAVYAMMGAFYWNRKKDEDWYREADDYTRSHYFVLTDENGKPTWRIPKSHEWGVIVSSMVEAALDSAYRQDPERVAGAFSQSVGAVNPFGRLLDIPIVKPAVEVAFDHDTFRDRPIVGPALERFEPKDQDRPWNTDTSRAIAGWLGVSPAKLEHFLDGSTGGLWGRATRALEGREIPGLGGVMVKAERGRTLDRFYEERKALEQKVNSAAKAGLVPLELADREHKFREYGQLMTRIREKMPADRKAREKYDRVLIGLARAATGEDGLERYPNPLERRNQIPPALQPVIDDWIGEQVWNATAAAPQRQKGEAWDRFVDRRDRHERTIRQAGQLANQLSLSQQEVQDALRSYARKRGHSVATRNRQGVSSFGRRAAAAQAFAR